MTLCDLQTKGDCLCFDDASHHRAAMVPFRQFTGQAVPHIFTFEKRAVRHAVKTLTFRNRFQKLAFAFDDTCPEIPSLSTGKQIGGGLDKDVADWVGRPAPLLN